nr:condensation domain-containing protein [Phaeobacter sp. B1627]
MPRGACPESLPKPDVVDATSRLQGHVRPLSPLQEGMYFHHLQVRNTVYLEQMTCEIRGPLDVDIATRVAETLVREHEILRTVFTIRPPKGLRQVILPYVRLDIECLDLRAAAEPDVAIEAILDREAACNLDLASAASRCKLLQLADETFVFLWTYHHIIMDSWTLLMLQEQFTQLYAAALRGEPLRLEKQPRQYRDYVDWTLGETKVKAVAFWRGYLGRGRSRVPFELPLETIDQCIETTKADLKLSVLDRLDQLASLHKVTPNSVFLAAWCAYSLTRHGREEDVIGCVYANRLLPFRGAGSVAGLFVNSLPIRCARHSSAAEQIKAVHRHMMQWPGNGWLSLSEIMATGGLTANDLSSLVNISIDQPRISNTHTSTLPIEIDKIRYREQAHFAVCLDVFLNRDNPSLAVRHDTRKGRWDASEVCDVLEDILAWFERTPDTSLRELVISRAAQDLVAHTDFDF